MRPRLIDGERQRYCRQVWDGHVVSVVEVLVIIQCSVLVVGGGYTGNVVV